MTAKRMLAIFLTAVLLLGLCACGGEAKPQNTAGGNALTLWSEPSTVKYLQFDEGKIAATAAQKSTLKLQMARNETEAVQLMLYAHKDIGSYYVTVSDLTCGSAVIASESIEIYHEYYQAFVPTGQASYPELAGGYSPDPLLPMATAVEYGENTIAEGNNQAVLIDVPTTAATAPGIYTGTVTVMADGESYTIPMEVTVHDIDLTGVTELKTAFSVFLTDHFASAELDSSQQMHEAYIDTLLKYNMSGRLPYDGGGTPQDYVELLRRYYFKDGFTAYAVYVEPTGSDYNGTATNVNLPLMQQYIRAIAYASVEDRVNYLDKAYAYFTTDVDEPVSEEQFLRAKGTVDLYFEMLSDCDKQLRAELAGTADYQWYTQVVSPTLVSIPDVIPGSYDISDVKKYGLDMLTVCPELSNFADLDYRKEIFEGRDDTDVWMYTCWGPVYPFANAHSSDIPLSTRTLGWMCMELNTPVYLMWGTSDYLNLEGGEPVEDAWTTGWTGQPSLGDGKLTYPGAKYGIYGPCASLRMVAYRDMSEDYQLLQIVKTLYEQQGLDCSVALNTLYRSLYTDGLSVNRDAYNFESIRTELFEMILNLQDGLDVLYSDVTVGIDTATVSFKLPDGSQVALVTEAEESANSQQLTPDENGLYTVTVDLTLQQSLMLNVTNGDQTRTISRKLMDGILGSVQDFEGNVTVDSWISCFGKNSSCISTDYAHDGTNSVKLTLNPDADDALPYFVISRDSELIGGSWKNITSLKLSVYNPGEEVLNMSVSYYTGTDVSLGSYKLQPGQWNTVELIMPTSAELADIDSIEEIDFNFEKGTAVTVYADSLVTVKEGQ